MLREVEMVRPWTPAESPDPDGKIGFISIGMSNTTMEFSTFKRRADPRPGSSRPGSSSSST